MNRMNPTSFANRAGHQLVQEWRAQWFLVLVWLAAAATECWQAMQDERPEIALPGFLPGLLAMIVIVRSVRADAPGNAEVGSHARPLGRGAVWLAKAVFFTSVLLLPWLVCAWVQWCGYGFGLVEWLAGLRGARCLGRTWGLVRRCWPAGAALHGEMCWWGWFASRCWSLGHGCGARCGGEKRMRACWQWRASF